ncbi:MULTISPECIES: RES family NAD+ phosphorylase [unclassified Burkholderia]|uniref:RES family NAD+ phosphorylase n=1 Tax=unclassified Burkholderia TaxID=2613784 RepID=UPI000F55F1A9|nr:MULTISPECIES: RES domain-containing protein [unclassified Burkholderia]RQR37293.1 RES domain-containing protein [Burkholderia sp. Bp9142]RQR53893.1 RES domain-containing protein [Burkholderia sp. Bp9140]
MKLFRIADTRHTIWSGTGAMPVGGRFNSPGRPVIHAALTFAGAMLEVLVHARIGKVPKTHGWVEATVPDDLPVERHSADTLPAGWDTAALHPARQFGDAWLTESRTAILVVPSVVARAEFNVLVNPAHPDAARIVVADPKPVVWDERLFGMPPAGRS